MQLFRIRTIGLSYAASIYSRPLVLQTLERNSLVITGGESREAQVAQGLRRFSGGDGFPCLR